MRCELFFFYSKDTNWINISNLLNKYPQSYRIVTDDPGLYQFLKNNRSVHLLDDLVPDFGEAAQEIGKISRIIYEKYKKLFQDVTYNGIKIFDGFGYSLLRQLKFLSQVTKILEDKVDTIFIFEGYFPVYFAMLDAAGKLGHKHDKEIGYIRGDKVEYFKTENENEALDYKNKFSLQKSFNLLKKSQGTSSFHRLRSFIRVGLRIGPFVLKMYLFRHLTRGDPISNVLREIDKKFQNTPDNYNVKCLFFITASRLDLYMKPLFPILDIFRNQKIPFQIITSDLATSLVLSEEKISFLSLFEEVNMLSKLIIDTTIGKEISQKIKKIVDTNDSLDGLRELSPDIINKVYRSLAVIIICEHIIKQTKLRSIFASADGEMLENLAISSCRKYNIPSYSIVPAVFNPHPMLAEWFHADKIFVYGLQGIEVLSKLGYNKERFLLTGQPKYDHFKTIDVKKSRSVLEKDNGICSDKKMLLVGMAKWNENDEKWMSELIRFCNENNFEIVIKIHPMYKTASREESDGKIDNIKQNCQNLKFLITYDVDIYTLLAGADLVITDFSNVGIEAILLEKPLLIANFTSESKWDHIKAHEYGAAIYIDNYNKLENTILEILKEDKHLEELQIGRRKITDQYNFHNDGNAAERIFRSLIDI